MKSEKENESNRWFSQKWIFDNTVALLGPESIAGGAMKRSYAAIGGDINQEIQVLRTRIRRFADISRELSRLALRRKQFAIEAEAQKHFITARDNYFAASLFYGASRWPIMEDKNLRLRELDSNMTECYTKYIAYADHPIERIKIPFDDGHIYAYFHKPTNEKKEFPTIVALVGMDSFKEQSVRLYGDRLLQRGFGVMAIDGPGQGESLTNGLKVKPDSFDRVGKSIMEYLMARSDVVHDEIALWGLSFGTYWGPRMIANENRYKAGAFQSVCHEPFGKSIFNSAHPAFKLRHMWMAGFEREDEFDRSYCSKLTLSGIGERISQPVLIAAGENDPLSPIEYTYEFFKTLGGPKRLMIFEGEPHGISDPQLPNIIGDFFVDVISDHHIETGITLVETGGTKRTTVENYAPP